jgi:pimeloyl-ACP methyl ester carboxylesterase
MIVKPENPADLLVEGKAELMHNCHDQLHLISASTLVIGGDKDFFCSLALLNETSAGIPNSKLIIHKGKGHMLSGKKFNNDILLFLDKI